MGQVAGGRWQGARGLAEWNSALGERIDYVALIDCIALRSPWWLGAGARGRWQGAWPSGTRPWANGSTTSLLSTASLLSTTSLFVRHGGSGGGGWVPVPQLEQLYTTLCIEVSSSRNSCGKLGSPSEIVMVFD